MPIHECSYLHKGEVIVRVRWTLKTSDLCQAGGAAQLVDGLSVMHEALSSIPRHCIKLGVATHSYNLSTQKQRSSSAT